ncbi:MAG: DUF1343 domain-containing protein [Bdellovibrionaceae bacterium]|nr:DUF1343 domain-containing protein [Pseudobdellovibrionaceae bacterium]
MFVGAEVLLNSSLWLKKLKNNRIAYLGNSASVDQKGELILSRLLQNKNIKLTSLFSPQHGFSSTKQANMITSKNSIYKGLKLYSLYSKKTRRLTPQMKQSFDILLFDLQDTGCRIYTYLSTLIYLMEDLEKTNKTLILLDRPNPLGRYVEGNLLKKEFKSFVGVAPLPMSHGLTLGEIALWYKHLKKLKTNLKIVKMKSYQSKKEWPINRAWILPSPNMTGLSCAKCYPGTVLLEGTQISEGRGTTKPFEIFGRVNMETEKIHKWMKREKADFLKGCFLRETKFEPAFDKFKNKTCSGFQIHLEKSIAKKGVFRPYRLMSLFLKAFKNIHPSVFWKSKAPYEYEWKLNPIDIISGSEDLKNWLDSSSNKISHWDDFLTSEERAWKKSQKDFFIYN